MINFTNYIQRKKDNLQIDKKCLKGFLAHDLKTIISILETDKQLEEIVWELTSLVQKYSSLSNIIKMKEGEIEGIEKAAQILQSKTEI